MQELQEILVQFLGQEDPWRRAWQPTLVFLPGEFQGQRSLVGSSPWGHKELDMTEVTNTHDWGCSLEGLMLKLKLQYFGHLM